MTFMTPEMKRHGKNALGGTAMNLTNKPLDPYTIHALRPGFHQQLDAWLDGLLEQQNACGGF